MHPMTLFTSTNPWDWLAPFGNSAILLPIDGLIALALLMRPPTRRTGWWWIAIIAGYAIAVAVSKFVYIAWGWHVPHFNFIGLSGDTATAFVIWPAIGAYLAARSRWQLQCVAIGIGAGLAGAVALSRVATFAHSIPEVIGGGLCGAAAIAIFLYAVRDERPSAPAHLAWVPVVVLVVGLVLTVRQPRPVDYNGMIARAATMATGHDSVYKRCDLGPWAALNADRRDCTPRGPETLAGNRSAP